MNQEPKTHLVRHWVRERILLLAIAIFAVGAVVYISASKIFLPDSIWLNPAKEFSLLLSMIGVVSLGYELFLREMSFNEYKAALQEIINPDVVRLGIKGIYKNRFELGHAYPLDKLFKTVQHEIFIGGTSLLTISTSKRELIREKILQGVTVKLLLINPNSNLVDSISRQGRGKSTFVNEIKTSLLLLQKLQEDIEHAKVSGEKGQLLIHTYDTIPSHSFISLDADEAGGLIFVDMGFYQGRNTPRPTIVVAKKENGFYDYWQEMNNIMWSESKPYYETNSSIDIRTTTLVFASGKETEYYDGNTDTWRSASICQLGHGWRTLKGGQWIWIKEQPSLEEARTGGHSKFRLSFHLPAKPGAKIVRADLFLRGNDICRLTINETKLNREFGGAEYPDPFIIDIRNHLKAGENIIHFELTSFARPMASSPEDNISGLIYRLDLEYRNLHAESRPFDEYPGAMATLLPAHC